MLASFAPFRPRSAPVLPLHLLLTARRQLWSWLNVTKFGEWCRHDIRDGIWAWNRLDAGEPMSTKCVREGFQARARFASLRWRLFKRMAGGLAERPQEDDNDTKNRMYQVYLSSRRRDSDLVYIVPAGG